MKKRISHTFEDHDCFDLKPFSQRLERFISIENQFVEGSLVLALNGGFGAGKSTFIEMWCNSLISRREKGEFVPMPVVLNAWESDHCGDPLVAILAGLVEVVENWKGGDAPDESGLKKAVKDVGWFATGLANEFLAKTVGINAVKAAELAEKKKEGRSSKVPDFISLYQERVAALRTLKDELGSAFGGVEPKVVVFVDELDRCRPDYAISFLETIKHVFDVEGIVFLLAVDYSHLSSSAKALFGMELNFDDYFRKFSHRIFDLPSPEGAGFNKLSEKFIRDYVHADGKRSCIMALEQHRMRSFTGLLIALRMRPRQVQEAFRIVGHMLATEDANKVGKLYWCIGVGAMLISVLRTYDRGFYVRLKEGVDDSNVVEELGRYLIDKLGKKEAGWWYRVFLAGCLSGWEKPQLDLESLLRKLEFVKGEFDARSELGQFFDGWGDGFTVWALFKRLENAESF